MVDKKIYNYVNKFINKLNLSDYIGIIVYGSYVCGRNNNLSDLDIMIIKENYLTQDCGSIMIDGVRVEYFVEDLKVLYKLTKNEVNNNDPSHLTKFVTCEILYDKKGEIKEFINCIKELYKTKITPMFEDNDKFSIFSINNRIEDLESLINDDSFYAVYYIILEKIRNLYSKINGTISLPITKIEKIYTDKDFAQKYIACEQHNLPSKEFIDLYLDCLKIDNKNTMISNLKKLYSYSFGTLDFNPKNFCLKFNKNCPFKV